MLLRILFAVLSAFVVLSAQPSLAHETEHHRVTEEILEELQDLRDDFDAVFGDRVDDDQTSGRGGDTDRNRDTGGNNTGRAVPDCIESWWEGKSLHYRNTCSYTVTVAYCDATDPIWGKTCGDNADPDQPYYTHMHRLCAGEERYWWSPGSRRWAVCQGFINAWAPGDDLTSDSTGRYGCHNDPSDYDPCD